MKKTDITIARSDAKPHPTKVAVFSAEDLPVAASGVYNELVAFKPMVEIDGVVMKFFVSPVVPKGRIFIVDRGAESNERAIQDRLHGHPGWDD